MYRLLFLSIFLITSCGGGGSSSSDEVNVSIPNNNQNDDVETCTNYEERILKCEFTHKGLDRYYYIQLAHPEAEGLSSVLFNLHGYGSSALEQMYYTNFNNLANT
jgi:poly(3-hydroxybutyrate) depolymerase